MKNKKKTHYISISPSLSKKERGKLAKGLGKEILKDKKYRNAVSKTAASDGLSRKNRKKLSSALATAAARAVVDTAVDKKKNAPKKRDALDVYTDIVAAFSKARKKKKMKQKKSKMLPSSKTGLIKLSALPKVSSVKKAKKHKLYKAKRK